MSKWSSHSQWSAAVPQHCAAAHGAQLLVETGLLGYLQHSVCCIRHEVVSIRSVMSSCSQDLEEKRHELLQCHEHINQAPHSEIMIQLLDSLGRLRLLKQGSCSVLVEILSW